MPKSVPASRTSLVLGGPAVPRLGAPVADGAGQVKSRFIPTSQASGSAFPGAAANAEFPHRRNITAPSVSGIIMARISRRHILHAVNASLLAAALAFPAGLTIAATDSQSSNGSHAGVPAQTTDPPPSPPSEPSEPDDPTEPPPHHRTPDRHPHQAIRRNPRRLPPPSRAGRRKLSRQTPTILTDRPPTRRPSRRWRSTRRRRR